MTSLARYADIRTIATVVSGTVAGETYRPIHDVQVDSRSCGDNSLFVAIEGDQTDGHLFLDDAFRRGSSLSFVSRQFFEKNREKILALCNRYEAAVLVVEKTVAALQQLARDYLSGMEHLTRVAITGSNGKTTTKELLGAMLSCHASTAVSPGNLNSDIGLPLACFAVAPGDRYAVFEMGTNRKGEIDELVSIVRPNVAAVTNIGSAHLGVFGSQEAIAREKRGVFAFVCSSGRGFVPEDDLFRDVLAEGRESCIDTWGWNSTPGFRSAVLQGIEGSRIRFDDREVDFPLMGKHNIYNALCAISVASWLGASSQCIDQALQSARPGFGRGEVLLGRATIILDCYNANRHSVLRALDVFESISWTGRKILVLGSIMELGEQSESEHRMVGRAAASSSADEILFFGKEACAAHSAAVEAGVRARHFVSFDDLAEAVSGCVQDEDLVLLKGSRALELERLVPIIDPRLKGKE